MKNILTLPLILVCLASSLPAATVAYMHLGSANTNQDITGQSNSFWTASNQNPFGGYSILNGTGALPVLTNHRFIFIEAGDVNASTLSSFLTTNNAALTSYVSAGGRLYIDAGRTTGGGNPNVATGFGDIALQRSSGRQGDTIITTTSTPTALTNGIAGNAGSTWSGTGGNNDAAGDLVTGTGTSLLRDSNTGTSVLLQRAWGSGLVWFGGLSAPNQWSNPTNGTVLFRNMLNYMVNTPLPNPAVPEPATILLLLAAVPMLMWRHRNAKLSQPCP